MDALDSLPPESVQILLVLFLSFLLGLEREEHKAAEEQYAFGGVRTFPLIGLIGYGTGLLSGGQSTAESLGLLAVAGFLWLSYRHKLETARPAGVTSEMSGLLTYVVGALVYHDQYWIATTLTVASLLLLELKTVLEGLARRTSAVDILTFTKFLLLTAVIIPLVPDREFTEYLVNPYKTWLVVVAVSGVSYGSYVLQRFAKGRGGVLLAAILGGAYSSTVTTVALARESARVGRPRLYAGAMLVACGVMYLRLAALLALFSRELVVRLAVPFLALAAVAICAGWAWSRGAPPAAEAAPAPEPKNPLELRTAFLFAAVFLAMLVATRFALVHLGSGGVYALSAIMGVSDVDPYIMGLTQSAGSVTPLDVAANSILIAAASNNAVKGVYALVLSRQGAGLQGLALLVGYAALGLVPLIL
ncbi:MAG: MgtC/SapB family protein [Proteobacteria bacterium]|nr:MgtC/SapB family protein [Pseudomonadota bacterium]